MQLELAGVLGAGLVVDALDRDLVAVEAVLAKDVDPGRQAVAHVGGDGAPLLVLDRDPAVGGVCLGGIAHDLAGDAHLVAVHAAAGAQQLGDARAAEALAEREVGAVVVCEGGGLGAGASQHARCQHPCQKQGHDGLGCAVLEEERLAQPAQAGAALFAALALAAAAHALGDGVATGAQARDEAGKGGDERHELQAAGPHHEHGHHLQARAHGRGGLPHADAGVGNVGDALADSVDGAVAMGDEDGGPDGRGHDEQRRDDHGAGHLQSWRGAARSGRKWR